MKKSSGLFEEWLMKFTTTVFSQSFQALFLVFIMNLIGELQKNVTGNSSDLIVSLVTFGGIIAITRLEKLVKGMLGIQDGMEGGLSQNFHAAMHGLRAGTDIAKRTTEPFVKYRDNKKKLEKINKKIAGLENDNPVTGGVADGISNAINNGNSNNNSGIITDGTEAIFNEGRKNGEFVLGNGQPTTNPVSASLDPSQVNNLINSINTLAGSMNQVAQNSQRQLSERKQEKLEDLKDEKAKLEKDISDSKFQRYTRLATTGAAIGMAAGGSSEGINETLQIANAIDTVMDAATDKMISNYNYNKDTSEQRELIKELKKSNDPADRQKAQEMKVELDKYSLKEQVRSFYTDMPVVGNVYKKSDQAVKKVVHKARNVDDM